ncbi:hypothetical protein BDQ12DRAFT_729688 [Crucibulum laeve]|uniref:Uncharacterized protein n=1 Tax=Crucibulum laeve TaxID=68775 RepID=A0A5C3LEJ8_9AGAR|nr:hypothetical protein BDQ12DRAFT_729688 [Crucibulum laeve]
MLKSVISLSIALLFAAATVALPAPAFVEVERASTNVRQDTDFLAPVTNNRREVQPVVEGTASPALPHDFDLNSSHRVVARSNRGDTKFLSPRDLSDKEFLSRREDRSDVNFLSPRD